MPSNRINIRYRLRVKPRPIVHPKTVVRSKSHSKSLLPFAIIIGLISLIAWYGLSRGPNKNSANPLKVQVQVNVFHGWQNSFDHNQSSITSQPVSVGTIICITFVDNCGTTDSNGHLTFPKTVTLGGYTDILIRSPNITNFLGEVVLTPPYVINCYMPQESDGLSSMSFCVNQVAN